MALPLTYNWRNLLVRKTSSLLTFVVVAIVVFVLAALLSFSAGMHASLARSGGDDNLVVLKPGATSESTSLITAAELSRILQAPGIALDANARPLRSGELCVQTSIPRKSDNSLANVAIRGVEIDGFALHPNVRMLEGRRFEPGALEVIVGKAARDRYRDLAIGATVLLGRTADREFRVVGIFEADGGALESEIWAARTIVADVYNRHFLSSINLRLANPDRAEEAIRYIRSPSVNLAAKTERSYYSDLSRKTLEVVALTTILVGIMAVGAAFAVSNTMYAAVDRRRREIAILRTIGFSRASIIASFLIESLLLCLAACAFGLACTLPLNGWKRDYLSDSTWTVQAFELRITPEVIATALIVACFVGVAGAMFPALRASRVEIISALRKA